MLESSNRAEGSALNLEGLYAPEKPGNLLDFSPTLKGEISFSNPAQSTANLPELGIANGTDLFLPDVQLIPSARVEPGTRRAELQPARVELSTRDQSALPANDRIAVAAQRNSESKPWVGSKYEPQVRNGRLAGAAAVSMILQDIGYKNADSANVGTLSTKLEKDGWQKVPLSEAKPGDVIYGGRLGKDWRAGGGNAHIGIIGADGKVWHNDSSTGRWQADSIADSFPGGKYGDQVWVLRPPQTNIPDKAVPDGPVRPSRPRPGSDNRPRPRDYDPTDFTPRPDDYTPRPDDYNPDPRDNPDLRPEQRDRRSNAKILHHARKSVDRRLWAQSDFANSVKGGRLGCAASVSEVLQMSGYEYANSAGVGPLVDILKQQGWTQIPLDRAQPGDVVYGGKPGTRWWAGGGNAHIGVVGEDGQVFHNSSGRKRWVQDDLTSVFNKKRFGDNRWVLRPPSR